MFEVSVTLPFENGQVPYPAREGTKVGTPYSEPWKNRSYQNYAPQFLHDWLVTQVRGNLLGDKSLCPIKKIENISTEQILYITVL